MLSESSIAFLKRLLDTPGPSGFESAPARVWRDEARAFADVTNDVAGNSMAVVNPNGAPTIMLAGHIDEIGVIVTYIDDEGYLYISGIGGWDPQVLVAQRIRIMGRDGDVYGVIGKKPIHVIKPEDRKKASEMTDLWIDIGATSREDAEKLVSVGDAGVIDSRTIDFPNNCIVSRSIDDRIGAFIVLEAVRRYAEQPGSARVVAVATTQEEIAFQGGGARVSATRIGPQMAIVVDVTHATDYPTAEKKEHGHHKIGAVRCSREGRSCRRWCTRCCATRRRGSRSRTRSMRPVANPGPTRMPSTSRARGLQRRCSRSPTATCTHLTRW